MRDFSRQIPQLRAPEKLLPQIAGFQSSVLHFRRYLGCFQLHSAQSTPRRVGLAARHTASRLCQPPTQCPQDPGSSGVFLSLLGDGSPPAQGAGPDCWLLEADYFSSHVLRAGKNEKKEEEREENKTKQLLHSQTDKTRLYQTGKLSFSECRVQKQLDRESSFLFSLRNTGLCALGGNLGKSFQISLLYAGSTLQQKQCCCRCCCRLFTKSCPTLCDPIDHSPPGSAVPGILQARILEWVAISSSRGSYRPRV